MRQHIAKVVNFPATVSVTPSTTYAATTAQVDDYVNTVLSNYDAALGSTSKLNIVMKEFHIASYGNGVEFFNAYRRTGMPTNMQPSLSSSPGPFIRTFWYPSDHVTLNLNAKQKPDNTVKVFWDLGAVTLF
jgi:hypothetical protein